jgi:hypothetical protein
MKKLIYFLFIPILFGCNPSKKIVSKIENLLAFYPLKKNSFVDRFSINTKTFTNQFKKPSASWPISTMIFFLSSVLTFEYYLFGDLQRFFRDKEHLARFILYFYLIQAFCLQSHLTFVSRFFCQNIFLL